MKHDIFVIKSNAPETATRSYDETVFVMDGCGDILALDELVLSIFLSFFPFNLMFGFLSDIFSSGENTSDHASKKSKSLL